MTDNKLQAAIDRRINDTYSEGVDGIHERLDDDSKLATAFIEVIRGLRNATAEQLAQDQSREDGK